MRFLVVTRAADALEIFPIRPQRVVRATERHLVVNIIGRSRQFGSTPSRVVYLAQRMLSAVHLADSLPLAAVPALLLGASVLVTASVTVSRGALRHWTAPASLR